MIRDIVAGIDSSTQSCTVMLRDLNTGTVVAEARAPHPPTTPPCSEQDPEAWWNAFKKTMGELRVWWPRIAGISVGGQGHGLVILDKNDRPLRPAKLWNDTESSPQAIKLCERLPASYWAKLTGSVPGPAMTISKLAWTEEHFPGLLEESRRIMLPCDYIVYKLSGNFVTERGGASGSGYFNPFKNCWEPELGDLINANVDWLSRWPKIISSSEPAGKVQASTGLEELVGAIVGVGTGDNMSAALGMNLQPGDMAMSIGTSGTLYGISSEGMADQTGMINGYADAADQFMPMITTLNAAKVTDTFRRILRLSTDEFDALALAAPPGSNSLTLLPWLDGERTPNLPDATGCLFNIRTITSAGDLARAAIEGVLANLLSGQSRLAELGFNNEGRLIITGGGSKSAAYCQILADLTGKTVLKSSLSETAAAGAAIQAAAAVLGCTNAEMAEKWSQPFVIAAEPRQDSQFVVGRYQQCAKTHRGEAS
ncbi:xylulokinase [Raoultella planticola]|uniref:xylulokinase n=1 Tax=Raoultella planticola TaxID=575 RepID=UPI00388FA457